MSIWKSKCVLFLEVVGRVRRCTKSKYNEKWTYMHPKDTLDAIWKFRQLLTIDHGFWISTIITYSITYSTFRFITYSTPLITYSTFSFITYSIRNAITYSITYSRWSTWKKKHGWNLNQYHISEHDFKSEWLNVEEWEFSLFSLNKQWTYCLIKTWFPLYFLAFKVIKKLM